MHLQQAAGFFLEEERENLKNNNSKYIVYDSYYLNYKK